MDCTDELCRLTEKCASTFTYLADQSGISDHDWLEDRAADFAWWSHGLKAQKTGRSSLDFRLRNRPDIQKIISGLLHSLLSALEEYPRSCGDAQKASGNDPTADRNETDDESSESDGSSTHSPWSELSIEGPEGKAKTSSPATPLSEDSGPRFFIKTNLSLLVKMSIAIRKSGAKLRYLKADEYLQSHMDNNEYMELRQHLSFLIQVGPYEQRLFIELGRQSTINKIPKAVQIVVRAWILDPSRITPIQQRLVETNVTRRNRIIYARRMFDKDAIPEKRENDVSRIVASSPVSEARLLSITQPTRVDLNVQKPHSAKPLDQPSSQHVESIRTLTATELGSQFVLPNLLPTKAKETQSIVTKVTRTGFKQDYPPCPAHERSFQCPYCVQVLPEEYSLKSRWRGHVAQDLSPYSCVYEACSDSQKLYGTKDEWIKHISTQHSIQRWVCDQCTIQSDLSEDLAFDHEQDWKQHMSSCHRDEFIDSQLAVLVSLSRRQLTRPVQCPLCKRPENSVRPDQDDHIAEHLHSWALMALPWDFHTKDQHSSDSPVLGSSDDLARLSNMSELSEDNGADTFMNIGENLDREISRWIHGSSNLPVAHAKPLESLIISFSSRLQDWNMSACLDEQNETVLQHLIIINQAMAQISRYLPLDMDSASQASEQGASSPQRGAERNLQSELETASEYMDIILSGHRQAPSQPLADKSSNIDKAGSLLFNTFPRGDDENIPMSDFQREELLVKNRDHIVRSGDVSECLQWARDVVMWAEVADTVRGIENNAQGPRESELQLKVDALDIISSQSDEGHPEALYLRGWCLEYGQLGYTMNKADAINSYRQASESGHGRSHFQMGWLLGEAGQWDLALESYQNALTLGDSAAKFYIGWMHLLGQHDQVKDETRGLALIKQAADTADEDAPLSAYIYGMLIARRVPEVEIPESSLTTDLVLARSYIAKSAYLGSPLALLAMGSGHELEEFGCRFDPEKSVHYLHLAARRGLSEAAVSLSRWFLLGSGRVVPRDKGIAFNFAQWAMRSRLPDAYFLMGCYFEFGIGATPNLETARSWYETARGLGHQGAAERIGVSAGDLP
ncbi:hypothetical protein EDB81DRAFT_728454 [Dactylonectria macrodidyma]|uniref:HCP-like protein n=1 Tax=Dactylonectria macrodidyma TaxID=307937 RepID=A0A9P9E2T0_9HYPO|nr:hypothetical protein EDB81DRAFT_728454 [Dactylonectria macrodidyma]